MCFVPSDTAVLVFLVAVNTFNYIDRGIVMGAPIQFGAFVQQTLELPEDEQQVWLGAITSSFIACYSVGCMVFGHLVHSVAPFRLLSCGLGVWCVAIFLSGVAYFLERDRPTFWLFLLSRAVSGVGEAAFQCIVPPYIDDFSPRGSKALWLGIFYTAIPVGTSLGFGHGAVVAGSIGWGYAYVLEAILIAPCALAMSHLPSAATLVSRRQAHADRLAISVIRP